MFWPLTRVTFQHSQTLILTLILCLRQFYHSLQDNYERMENGSVQYLGDNILAAVKAFAASPELNKTNPDHDPRVFFDISGKIILAFYYYVVLTCCLI